MWKPLLLGVVAITTSTPTVTVQGALPNGYVWGCLPGNISAHLPFCDPTLDAWTRAKDLVSRLTLNEKMGLLGREYYSTYTCIV